MYKTNYCSKKNDFVNKLAVKLRSVFLEREI